VPKGSNRLKIALRNAANVIGNLKKQKWAAKAKGLDHPM